MNNLSATFDRKISLFEFNKEVKKLLENFSKNQKLLIEVKIEGDNIIANVKENPDQQNLNVGYGIFQSRCNIKKLDENLINEMINE